MHQRIRTETGSEEKVLPKDTAVVQRTWTRTETGSEEKVLPKDTMVVRRDCTIGSQPRSASRWDWKHGHGGGYTRSQCLCANHYKDGGCWHTRSAQEARGKEPWRWVNGISYKVGVFPHTIQVIPESCDVSFTSFARMCCRSYSHAFTLQKRRRNLTVKTIVTSLSLKGRWPDKRFEHLHQWICFNREDIDHEVHETDSPDPVFVEEFGANAKTGGCSDEHGIPRRSFDITTGEMVEGRTWHMGQNPWRGDTCERCDDSELVDHMFSSESDFKRFFVDMYESVMGVKSFRHNRAIYTFLKFTDGAPSSFIISFGRL